jgi:hypothetical protein
LLHRPDGQEPGGQVVAAHFMRGRCGHLETYKAGSQARECSETQSY